MTHIDTDRAPSAIGPYSQGRVHQSTLYVSGQLPIDPVTKQFVSDDPAEQTRQCLRNIAAIAQAAGTSLDQTLKTTVLVTDLGAFASINAAYGEFFQGPYPARATFQVAALPLGARVEIEAVISLD